MNSSDSHLEATISMEGEKRQPLIEAPFHLLVIGDWSGSGAKKDVKSRRPIEIDRDNFDEVMSRIGPKLELEIDGRAVSLKFTELADFHPDRIFEQVPLFSELLTLRKRLQSDEMFNAAAREVRASMGIEPPEPTPVQDQDISDDLLSKILEQPTGGSPAKKRASSSELESLVGELVRPHLINVDEVERAEMLAEVDSSTSKLMRKILHDHHFQALEAAWRGMFFLVRRTETTADLKLFILDISQCELESDLKDSTDLTASLLYRTLIAGGNTFSAVIGNYGFLPNVDDIAALMRISRICAAANAPFVSHMRPDVIGVHSLVGNSEPRSWNLSEDSPEGKLWSALRSVQEAVYLGMTIPRFLGRLPYGLDTEPLESFSFEEFMGMSDHNNYLWINSCFACGLLLAQSFSSAGWQMGQRLVREIDSLPLHSYENDGDTIITPVAEVQLTEAASDTLTRHGLMPLVSYKDTDRLRLVSFQSISDPISSLRGPWQGNS